MKRRFHKRSLRPQEGAASSGTITLMARWRTWWLAKNPVFRFVSFFGALIGCFYVLAQFRAFKHELFPFFVRLNARLANWVLNLLSQDTGVTGTNISSASFSVDVRRGCDALEPTILFVAAVLAFPAPIRRKIPGVLVGALLLFSLNLVRIVSLYFIGVHYPSLFEFMHVDAWQVLFILLAVFLWIAWIVWTARPRTTTPRAAAQPTIP